MYPNTGRPVLGYISDNFIQLCFVYCIFDYLLFNTPFFRSSAACCFIT